MNVNASTLLTQARMARVRHNNRFSRRLLLWMAGLTAFLTAGWLLWASVDAQSFVGIIISSTWLINIVIQVVFIDSLLRKSALAKREKMNHIGNSGR